MIFEDIRSLVYILGKDVYGRPVTWGAPESILSSAQGYANKTGLGKIIARNTGSAFGESDPIVATLREAGITNNLAEQKEIAEKMKAMFPGATDEELVQIILESVNNAAYAGR